MGGALHELRALALEQRLRRHQLAHLQLQVEQLGAHRRAAAAAAAAVTPRGGELGGELGELLLQLLVLLAQPLRLRALGGLLGVVAWLGLGG